MVPAPIGLAAVFVAGGEPRFEAVGRTPGVAHLLLGLQPRLAAIKSINERDNWFRADVDFDALIDPHERGPLGLFFDDAR